MERFVEAGFAVCAWSIGILTVMLCISMPAIIGVGVYKEYMEAQRWANCRCNENTPQCTCTEVGRCSCGTTCPCVEGK